MFTLSKNPSARDIIARSLFLHPSFFSEALQERENSCRAYAFSLTHGRTRQAVEASVRAYRRAREFTDCEDLSARSRAVLICEETGSAVVALNVACKLQCLPGHVRTAAAIALDNDSLERI